MPYGFEYNLRKATSKSDSVLDIGCGPDSPLQFCRRNGLYSVGVDLFGPYLRAARTRHTHRDLVRCDGCYLPFRKNSFDASAALDVIEHLTKKKGLSLLKEMCRVSRKIVIIMTPNGWIHQRVYDENPFQAHNSGWRKGNLLDLGFEVTGIRGVRFLRTIGSRPRFRPLALGYFVVALSEVFGWLFSSIAFQVVAIKYPGIKSKSEREENALLGFGMTSTPR